MNTEYVLYKTNDYGNMENHLSKSLVHAQDEFSLHLYVLIDSPYLNLISKFGLKVHFVCFSCWTSDALFVIYRFRIVLHHHTSYHLLAFMTIVNHNFVCPFVLACPYLFSMVLEVPRDVTFFFASLSLKMLWDTLAIVIFS